MPTNLDADGVGAGPFEQAGDLDRILERISALHQLGARMSHDDRIVVAARLLDGLNDFHAEAGAVFERAAVFVLALV